MSAAPDGVHEALMYAYMNSPTSVSQELSGAIIVDGETYRIKNVSLDTRPTNPPASSIIVTVIAPSGATDTFDIRYC